MGEVTKMNPYIAAQIFNAKAMAKNIDQACQQTAKENNKKISKNEKKLLKEIHAITIRYISDLDKLS